MTKIQDKIENDQSQSQWDDLFLPNSLDYEGPIPKIKSISTHLRQMYPDDEVEIEVQFETYNLLQKFEKKLEFEYEIYRPEPKIVEKNDWDTIWREIHDNAHSKRVPGMDQMKVNKILFNNPLECTVFYYHYEKKLKQLEKEYDCIIIPHRKNLALYLMNPHDKKINSFFVTELLEMKNKLKMRTQSDKEIFIRARYSKSAVQMLEKINIKTMILSRYESTVFYSHHYENVFEIKNQVRKIIAYHSSLIKFPEVYVNKYILKEIMRLIYFEIKPQLKEIEKYFDMPVEVDIEKAAILITDFHQVFTDGVDLVKESLYKLKILEIQCEDLVEMKQILMKAQYLPLVKFNYRYRKCFLLFNDNVTQKNPKIMPKFCQEISSIFKGKYRIIVHFTHLFQSEERMKEQIQRIRAIAAEYNINNIIHSTFTRKKNFDKVALEPVELSIYNQEFRKKQVQKFFLDYVTNRKVETEVFKYEVFESIEMDESLLHECQEESFFMASPFSRNTDNIESSYGGQYVSKLSDMKEASVSTFDASLGNRSDFLQLSIPFFFPTLEQFDENTPIKAGKRDTQLETLMETEFKRRLRVWKVIIHFSVGLPSIKSHDGVVIADSEMFEMRNSYYRLKKLHKLGCKKMKEFKEGEIGHICFVNREKDMFFPIFRVQFLSEQLTVSKLSF